MVSGLWCRDGVSLDLGNGGGVGELSQGRGFIEGIRIGPGDQRGFSGVTGGQAGS